MSPITCLVCDNEGEHDSKTHYVCTPNELRPKLVMALRDKLEIERGVRPLLEETMALLGVKKEGGNR